MIIIAGNRLILGTYFCKCGSYKSFKGWHKTYNSDDYCDKCSFLICISEEDYNIRKEYLESGESIPDNIKYYLFENHGLFTDLKFNCGILKNQQEGYFKNTPREELLWSLKYEIL